MATRTAMAMEIRETPKAADRLLRSGVAHHIAARIGERSFPFVVVCGRGSSGHVGVYLRYLVETRLGLIVSASAPSVVTSYRKAPAMSGALFIVISQSGRSPDLLAATRAARAGGALTLAIVNDPASPVAELAELVLPLAAGPELAVAATKTVVNSCLACAALVALWSRDQDLLDAVQRIPARLEAAQDLDWSPWTAQLAPGCTPFVTGRGNGFGPIREIALKVSETLRLPALSYSAAELRHGPRAALGPSTPLLALRQNDEVAGSVDALLAELPAQRVPVQVCGGPYGTLPWLPDDHPALDPVVMLIPAYHAIEREARARGFDPDSPPSLTKVTETL
jgi:glucosamine--fructose-6-phosphate aminotransferase (isomerizing)